MKVCSNSHVFRKTLPKDGFSLLTISDVHFDSKHCDRELLTTHLNQARERKAEVLIIGDFFDVMGCKRDPRSMPSHVRSEYLVKGRSYLDLVVEDAYNFLKPYADIITLIGQGNHESAILRHNETDVLDRLVFLLNRDSLVYKGGYSGWVSYVFNQPRRQAKLTQRLAYHHGSGGNAKRSKGLLDADLDMAHYPDADIILKGHNHNRYLYQGARIKLNDKFIPEQVNQYHLRLGSYKNEYGTGESGWAIEKGFSPQPRGGWWINYKWHRVRDGKKQKESIITEIIPA